MAKCIYIGNPTSKKVKTLYTGVNNTSRKIKKAYVGVGNNAKMFWPSIKTLGELNVSTIVKIKEYGVYVNYIIIHQGIPNSSYGSSCDGTWLMRSDIDSLEKYDSSGVTDLYGSNLYRNVLSSYYSRLTNVKSLVKTASIPCYYEEPTTSYIYNQNMKVFLLSGVELGLAGSGWSNEIPSNDGTLLDYFTYGDSTYARSLRIANYNGQQYSYWTRSPRVRSSRTVITVTTNGSTNSDAVNLNELGVRPVFILPYNVPVSNNMAVG